MLTRAHAAVVLAVVAFVGFAVFFCAWLGALTVGVPNTLPFWGDGILIKDVSVDSVDPLVLTVTLESIINRNVEFDHGYIQDESLTVVAQCLRTVSFGSVSDGRGHWVQYFVVCVLPANSEETMFLSFDTSLLSGNYRLTLNKNYYVLCSDYFAIP